MKTQFNMLFDICKMDQMILKCKCISTRVSAPQTSIKISKNVIQYFKSSEMKIFVI